jgi:two-component system, NtrC family, sensor kinase
MSMLKRFGWLPTTCLAMVLASILAFLYVKTRAQTDSSYFENVALLRELKQLDARWELDVLKSKMGLNTNYDSLVDPLLELNQLRGKLQTIVVTNKQHVAAIGLSSEAFDRAIQEKTRLIEHFKSHNSVLRNSLVFLPTAADDIQDAIGRSGDQRALNQIFAGVNKVLLDSMVYSQAPSDEKAAEIRLDLNQLAANKEKLPAAVSEGLDIFSSHVSAVLREQPVVNGLLVSIAAVPVAARIDDLDNFLSAEQQVAGLQAQQYRQYLLIFAAALGALLLYAAARLIRSHAIINRVNKALNEANASLEQRVQERTRELHAAQSALVATARQAGMAEIANNVLHNVGNVLNSVNVYAGLVGSTMRDSKAQGVAKAVALMNERAADLGDFLTHDEKGKLLLGYLNKVVAALSNEQQNVVEEIGSLSRSIDHIKDIVATQQTFSGAACLVEAVQITDLLEDALRMNDSALTRHRVVVVREFADVPLLLLDKSRLLQILVNLIGNAKNAMDGVADRSHRITLRVDVADPGDGAQLRIRVEDDGEGIAAENLPRLFAHGFTTRKNGHGFGLHSSALAANEMGGTLTAHSDGRDKGATFTLELPMVAP